MKDKETSLQRQLILHIIDSNGFGGGERYLSDLVRYASDDFIHVVMLPGKGHLKTELDGLRVDSAVIDLSRRFSVTGLKNLNYLMRYYKPSIVHSHGYRANIHSRLSAKTIGIPHICTVHVSLFDYIDTPFFLRWMYRFAERFTAIFSEKIICISKAMYRDTIKLGVNKKKIIYIPNGVDLNRFYPREPNKNLLKEIIGDREGPVIGTIGRAVTEKGQLYLIQALVPLKKGFPDLTCLIFGDGPLLPDLKRAASISGISDMCIFPGVREDIEEVYPLLDLFVLPSLREPFGLVLIEAMASGKPVIATDSGGPMDFIKSGDNGLLVQPKDPAAIAEAIKLILSNPEKRKQIALTGYWDVKEKYDIRNTVHKIEDVYRSVVQ